VDIGSRSRWQASLVASAELARANGISTRLAAQCRQPEAGLSQLPPGQPRRAPHDPENQSDVLRSGLKLLEEADRPGIIVDLPYVWSESTLWIKKFMTADQPFLSEEAEARRQEELKRAREQKASQSQQPFPMAR
jgi:hypothetical protein